ncbi:oxidoreductase [Streptomyces lonarensis]|uniref:SDR family NAD(P)-dependent oxidoreductase n=1 Tax=Streptomyces lonarensis TaxID=700599 RepID=A0A7X6D234_9ACTN|nr:oxidoreductase [Streptomyces lonarensis]NJQ06770.1 SDR family NAD(P)-dependent oxidoreductase [Streptomyces lonarensis]
MARWTASDIPRLTGTTAVVTGANSGIGAVTALLLARAGARTVLACRDAGRGGATVERIRRAAPGADVRLVLLDLADLASVREAAPRLAAEAGGRLELLVNNAGVMALPLRRTADGFEMQFGTNHLGHFALTGLLGEALVAGSGRVVTVSSLAHRIGGLDLTDPNAERGRYDRWRAYGASKLANLLFTDELDRRAAAAGVGLTATAAHPGLSSTELGQAGLVMEGRRGLARLERATRVFTQPAARGALPVLRAATDPAAAGGDYFGPDGPLEVRGAGAGRARRSSAARDPRTAADLWETSVTLTGVDPAAALSPGPR